MGYLFDAGVTVTHQLAMLGGYTLLSACLLIAAAPRMRRRGQ
jgi:hypothetical protein